MMDVQIEGEKLIITIDCSQEAVRRAPLSKSGKSYSIATSGGNRPYRIGDFSVQLGYNCYMEAPADDLNALTRQYAFLMANPPKGADVQATNDHKAKLAAMSEVIETLKLAKGERDANQGKRDQAQAAAEAG